MVGFGMAKVVKVSVSVDAEKLRLAKARARMEGVSLSAILTRGLQHELDACARLDAALALYGPDEWLSADDRRMVIESRTTRTTTPTPKRRTKRKAA
jgi:sarcosine oxidase gamma subunit